LNFSRDWGASMHKLSFPVSEQFLESIRDFVVKQHPCSSHYLCRLPLSMLDALPECTSMSRTYFPDALPVDCVIYLVGENMDTPWHVDTEPGIWGSNYMNLLIPLVIYGKASIRVLEEDVYCSMVTHTNSDDDQNVNLTMVTSDVKLHTEQYRTQHIDLKIGNAYIFSGSSPHRTIPGGFRMSMIIGFVKDKNQLINLHYSVYVGQEVAKMLAILFNGVQSEDPSVLAKRFDDYIQNLIQAKDINQIDAGWRSTWMIAMTVLSNITL